MSLLPVQGKLRVTRTELPCCSSNDLLNLIQLAGSYKQRAALRRNDGVIY